MSSIVAVVPLVPLVLQMVSGSQLLRRVGNADLHCHAGRRGL